MRRRLSWSAGFCLVSLVTSLLVPLQRAEAAPGLPGAPTGVSAVGGVLSATVTWKAPKSHAAGIASYAVTSSPGGRMSTVSAKVHSALVQGLLPGVTYRFAVTARNSAGPGHPSASSKGVATTSPGLRMLAVGPVHLAKVLLGQGSATTLVVGGKVGVPADAAAVVLSVHVIRTSAAGTVTVAPAGPTGPVQASVTSAVGSHVSSLVLARLGSARSLILRNSKGSALVSVDVTGWVPAAATGGAAGLLTPVPPAPLLASSPVRSGPGRSVQVTGQAGVPTSGVSSVLVRVTVTAPTKAGAVVVSGAGPAAGVASVTFVAHSGATAESLVRLGSGGKLRVVNRSGTAEVAVDVLGWMSSASGEPTGSFFTPVAPARLLAASVGPTRLLGVAGRAGVPSAAALVPAVAVVLAVTATRPTKGGTLNVSGAAGGDAEITAGKPISTIVIAPVTARGQVVLSVSHGSTPVTVDVLGYYSGSAIRSARTKILSGAATAAITQVATDAVTFGSHAPAAVKALAVGDVVAAGVSVMTPQGLLRTVTGVSVHADGSRTLSTTQAALSDAIISGSGSTRPPAGVSAARATFSHAIDRTFPFDQLYAVETASLHVTGSLQLHAEMDLDVSIHASLFHPVSAQLTLAAQETFTADAEATAELSYEKEVPLAEEEEPVIIFVVLDVPVVVTPKVTADLDLGAHAHGDIAASITQTRGYVATLGYSGGQTTATTTPTGDSPQFTGPSGSATADIKAGEKFAYHFLMYGVAGPYVSGEPYLQVSTDGCGAALSYGVDLAGGLEANILDHTISVEKSFEALTGVLASTGYHCKWSGQVTSTQSGTGSCDFVVSCTFDITAVFTPTYAEERFADGSSPEQWRLIVGYDWQLTYHTHFDDSTGSCVDFNDTTGGGSGHIGVDDSVTGPRWHGGTFSDAYSFFGATPGLTGSEHFYASGPDGCDHVDETVAVPVGWQSDFPIDGPLGAFELHGAYTHFDSGDSVPIVESWQLVRHLPGT